MNLETLLEEASERGARRAVAGVLEQLAGQLGLLVIRPDDDTSLTLEEAAAFLKLDPKTVRGLLETGEIAGRKAGAQWRIPKWGLRRYLDPLVLSFQHLAQAAD